MPEEASKSEIKLEFIKEITLPTAVLAMDLDSRVNNKRAFAACLDGHIYEVNLETGEETPIGTHESYASGVRYLAGAERLISAGYDGVLQWHEVGDRKTERRVQAHQFWSWQMDISPDEKWVASVTGQYLAGGYKYEPAPEQEPSVKIFNAQNGELRWSFAHLPPVLSVAFSPCGKYVAAGNMMGELRVWDLENGKEFASWKTPDFTSWGIIKSHHYVGGIFGLTFTPDSSELVACGMGPMNDPMAGNGKQKWQRFAWRENPPRKTAEINEGESGNGLMETIQYHPSAPYFLMAGRMAQGRWNAALFHSSSGQLLHSLDTKMRVTDSAFGSDGSELFLAGATSQEKKKDGKLPPFGRIRVYRCLS